jgi:hypothetical protein
VVLTLLVVVGTERAAYIADNVVELYDATVVQESERYYASNEGVHTMEVADHEPPRAEVEHFPRFLSNWRNTGCLGRNRRSNG